MFILAFGLLINLVQWPALGAFLVTFPTGRFTPRWSSFILLLWLAQDGLFFLGIANGPPLLLAGEQLLVWGSTFGIQVYRYVRVYDAVQRQQTKWFVYACLVGLTLHILLVALPGVVPVLSAPDSWYQLFNAGIVLVIIFLPIPLGIGIAILRYRLWDIDLIINRTLVYSGLSASVIGVYVLVVVYLGELLHTGYTAGISLVATGIIAVLFQPVRGFLQRGVNRLMYGERDEPYRVLARLGQRLEATLTSDAMLSMIVETVAQALKLPFAAITGTPPGANGEATMLATYGQSHEHVACERVPLIYQHEVVGALLLAPRQRGEMLTPADQRLLRDLSPQIGVAVHAVRLTSDLKQLTVDLQHSRERLVTAREEERRRLRRDLHDGLGPQLSSQTLTLTAARKLLRQDPDAADRLLADATTHAQEAIADIRRLVYALRPPALDDLGLLAALQEQLTQYRASGVSLILDAPEHLPPLPAAVEVACYRILQEALTNVMRHAHAHVCTIHLTVEKDLVLEIRDDGQGLPPAHHSGIGLTSMRERAEELGGTCTITSLPQGGTCVLARLPLA